MAKGKANKRRRKQKTVEVSVKTLYVDNPNYNGAYDGERSNPKRVPATVNMRESPALWLYSHNQIDEAQFRAAQLFRSHYERSGGAGVSAIDTTKDVVDGGVGVSDGLTDARQRAAKALNEAHHALGAETFKLVETVCGECHFISQFIKSEWAARMAAKQLKEALLELAELWCLKSRERRFYRDAS